MLRVMLDGVHDLADSLRAAFDGAAKRAFNIVLHLPNGGKDALHALEEGHRHRQGIPQHETERHRQHMNEWVERPVPLDEHTSELDEGNADYKTDQSRAKHFAYHVAHRVEELFDQGFNVHFLGSFPRARLRPAWSAR